MIEIINCVQGEPAWFECRRGLATSSKFATIMAKGDGKTRKSYMLQLAGEIISGELHEGYKNDDMIRGQVMEAEARDMYAMLKDIEPERVGFVKNGRKGCSPDSFIGAPGMLEIKTKIPSLLIECILRDDMPPEHRAQCQGNLWVAEREWIDIMVYWPKMTPFIHKAYRDEAYIRTMSDEVDRFNEELDAMVEKVRRYGQ